MGDGLSGVGLSVQNLSVRFEETLALDEVSVEVPTGEVLAVLGPSGCGKSTLLRCIAGLERPTAGTILYDGVDLANVATHKRGFALMFQDGQLFAHRTVAGNIGYPLRLRHVGRARVAEQVARLLTLVGLEGYDARMPSTLSGGESQRVALARALAVEPRLLLLDEPLSALDRGLRERLSGELRGILHDAGTTALLVTHDQEEAFAVADRMAVMRAGRIIQCGTVAEVWAHPADAWTALFLGYASVLEGEQALRLRALIAPTARWQAVALRRSAFQVEREGRFRARVIGARRSTEQTRLDLEVEGVGELAGVADPGLEVRIGELVRVGVVLDRIAPLPEV